MSDPRVQRWRQRGRIFLWRYRDRPRNYPGWHLSADPLGTESLLELLNLMREALYSSQQIVRVTDPNPNVLSVPNYITGGDNWQSAHLWKLRYPKGQADEHEWSMTFTGSELQLTVGEGYLLKLISGVEAIAAGRGDYAISAGDTEYDDCLWFW